MAAAEAEESKLLAGCVSHGGPRRVCLAICADVNRNTPGTDGFGAGTLAAPRIVGWVAGRGPGGGSARGEPAGADAATDGRGVAPANAGMDSRVAEAAVGSGAGGGTFGRCATGGPAERVGCPGGRGADGGPPTPRGLGGAGAPPELDPNVVPLAGTGIGVPGGEPTGRDGGRGGPGGVGRAAMEGNVDSECNQQKRFAERCKRRCGRGKFAFSHLFHDLQIPLHTLAADFLIP
jgi:hypothetical protein